MDHSLNLSTFSEYWWLCVWFCSVCWSIHPPIGSLCTCSINTSCIPFHKSGAVQGVVGLLPGTPAPPSTFFLTHVWIFVISPYWFQTKVQLQLNHIWCSLTISNHLSIDMGGRGRWWGVFGSFWVLLMGKNELLKCDQMQRKSIIIFLGPTALTAAQQISFCLRSKNKWRILHDPKTNKNNEIALKNRSTTLESPASLCLLLCQLQVSGLIDVIKVSARICRFLITTTIKKKDPLFIENRVCWGQSGELVLDCHQDLWFQNLSSVPLVGSEINSF